MKTEFLLRAEQDGGLIRRNYPAEFRSDAESGIITVCPVVFDTPTDIGGLFQETIVRGAISYDVLNDVGFYFNHDLNSKRIARSLIPFEKLGGMAIEITPEKIIAQIRANMKRHDVNDLYYGIEDGVIDGASFMFGVREDYWEDLNTDYPKRFVTKIDPVVEFSAVNYPAYKTTSINVSRGDLLTENDKAVLEKIRAEKRATADTEAKAKRELELLKLKAKYLY